MRVSSWLSLVVVIALANPPAGAQSTSPDRANLRTITGVAKTVTKSEIVIERDGVNISFAIIGSTRYVGKGARPSDLVLRTPPPTIADIIKPGDRVRISYRQSGSSNIAVEVRFDRPSRLR